MLRERVGFFNAGEKKGGRGSQGPKRKKKKSSIYLVISEANKTRESEAPKPHCEAHPRTLPL